MICEHERVRPEPDIDLRLDPVLHPERFPLMSCMGH